MSGLLLGGAALVAVALVVFARWRQRRARAALEARPGWGFERPLEVRGYDEVDGFVRRARCPACEGYLATIGEDTAQVDGRPVHVVRTRCDACEERYPLVFDVSGVPN